VLKDKCHIMPEINPNPAPQAPIAEPKTNKWLTPLIVVAAVIMIAGGYFTYSRWQQTRTVGNILEEMGVDKDTINQFNEGMADYAKQIAEETAKMEAEANKSPEEKFADAETMEVTGETHKNLSDEVARVIEKVFGDTKITGYTAGYMGMNSGSGVFQFMTPKALSINQANDLKIELENSGFHITNTTLDGESAKVEASKDNRSYSFDFNKGEQEIAVIIIAANE